MAAVQLPLYAGRLLEARKLNLKKITGSVALLPVDLAQQRTTHSNQLKENDATKTNYFNYYTYTTYHSSVCGRRAFILRAKLRLCR